MEKERFDITGMTCSSCSTRVEKAVDGLEGVETAAVNLLTNSMTVEYDPAAVDAQGIVDAVEKAGYGAVPVMAENTAGKASGQTVQGAPTNVAEMAIKEMKHRIIVSFAFLIPLMYVSMGSMVGLPLPGFLTGMGNSVSFAFTQFLLTLPVVVVNRKYYSTGFKTLWHRAPNMDSLIAVGSGAALVYGVFALYRMSWALGAGEMAVVHQYHMDLYFESAAMILALITLGKYLEARAKGKTSEAISKLIDLSPKTAMVIRDGVEVEVPADSVRVDEICVVRPGASIPIDGVVVEGQSAVDEAAITGESIPVEKSTGDAVIAATINTSGFLKVRATKVGEDTAFSEIIRLVQEASASKAPIAHLADKIAGIFVPVVMVIALVATIVWLVSGSTFEFALSIGIAVLVISCPCALGLATPVAIMVGTGKGAENGILIKSGDALETACKVDTVVLDKTGTITTGKPVVTDVQVLQAGLSEPNFLALAGALEAPSGHPLADAVVDYVAEQGLSLPTVSDFKALLGMGVEGRIAGRMVYGGNLRLLKDSALSTDLSTDLSTIVDNVDKLSELGRTPLIFFDDTQVLGIIAVADAIKADSVAAVAEMKAMGLSVVMLTGDNAKTAEAIRAQAGIGRVVAGVLPADKEKEIQRLKAEGHQVAMVGDGINDAPALAAADVGMAIGAGTDVAIESADIVLMHSGLTDVSAAIRLSRSVIRNIKENLFWAFFYNVIGIPIAAGVLYPALGMRLSPMLGALAMSLSSVCVVLNALRLKGLKLKKTSVAAAPKVQDAPEVKAVLQSENNESTLKEELKMMTLKINGMNCMHCVGSVKAALEAIPGVQAIVDLDKGTAMVQAPGDVSPDRLKKAVADAGFTVTAID
ncbi:heavy metal translocating P-type ATPase [Eubacterium sp.]|uniref:heavy metal translocating P-type ATPase n=1 Tax=Eubacterium sp. TaxID=142586 RepID=UPI002FCB14D8